MTRGAADRRAWSDESWKEQKGKSVCLCTCSCISVVWMFLQNPSTWFQVIVCLGLKGISLCYYWRSRVHLAFLFFFIGHYTCTLKTTINLPFPIIVPCSTVLSLFYHMAVALDCHVPRLENLCWTSELEWCIFSRRAQNFVGAMCITCTVCRRSPLSYNVSHYRDSEKIWQWSHKNQYAISKFGFCTY